MSVRYFVDTYTNTWRPRPDRDYAFRKLLKIMNEKIEKNTNINKKTWFDLDYVRQNMINGPEYYNRNDRNIYKNKMKKIDAIRKKYRNIKSIKTVLSVLNKASIPLNAKMKIINSVKKNMKNSK